MHNIVSPSRNGTRLPQPGSSQDARNSLPRRFTTDSGRVPTLSQISTSAAGAQQRPPQMPQNPDITQAQALHQVQLLEKKRLEYERIREQKRRFELEMQKLDQQEKLEEQELAQMTEDLGRMAGHQSEPTTPPEYREPAATGFPTFLSRPNRYSTSSLTSPPGVYNRPGRSGSQLASPQSGMVPGRFAFDDQLPTRSFPATRRNSDDDEKEEAVRQDPTSHRSTNALNRYSMPVTKSRSGFYDIGLDQTNTTRFLFGDEEATSDTKGFNIGSTADDSFPTLTRREDQPNMLSASSAALDLAYSQSAAEDPTPNGWGNRQRNQTNMSQTSTSGDSSAFSGRPSSYRLSLNSTEGYSSQQITNHAEAGAQVASPPTSNAMPRLTSSLSANDVPTSKNMGPPSALGANPNNRFAEHAWNVHNSEKGRTPSNRQSREFPAGQNRYQPINSVVHSSQTSFGIGSSLYASQPGSGAQPPSNPNMGYSHSPYYSGYPPSAVHNPATYNSLVGGVQGLSMQPNLYQQQQQQPYPGFAQGYNQQQQPATHRDSQPRVMADRRRQDQETVAQYSSMNIRDAVGQIYTLCRDQHGCRFLQRQLESRDPEAIHQIWLETHQHVVELMVDPFGNYLCQKLLEFCDENERTDLVKAASRNLVKIALNQHGTRALQKMIEFLNTQEQTLIVIEALRDHVVELIQDLNGNHVIQKCLNKLSSEDAEFIFQAVGDNCIEVGTHRHGCCVLQRCIDHAAGQQKGRLIQNITKHALILVQDPFGNYVIQYIIDLNEPDFTEPLVVMFIGQIVGLSRHKFSSNVIEKCLRCSTDASKDMIVTEMLQGNKIDQMLRDSFANYVVQTALEYSTPGMKIALVDAIRPLLPAVRNTPYGRRISAKIQTYDSRSATSATGSGSAIPSHMANGNTGPTITESNQAQIPLRSANPRGMQNQQPGMPILSGPGFGPGMGTMNGAPSGGNVGGISTPTSNVMGGMTQGFFNPGRHTGFAAAQGQQHYSPGGTQGPRVSGNGIPGGSSNGPMRSGNNSQHATPQPQGTGHPGAPGSGYFSGAADATGPAPGFI